MCEIIFNQETWCGMKAHERNELPYEYLLGTYVTELLTHLCIFVCFHGS